MNTAWALRLAFVACLTVCALGPTLPGESDRRARVVVVDRSRSMGGSPAVLTRTARAALSDLHDDDRVALVLAGAEPVVAVDWKGPAQARADLDRALASPLDPWGSDLGAALRLATELALQEPGRREILLISDGRDTSGGAGEAASAARDAAVRVHAFAPSVPRPSGARVVRLDAPQHVAPRVPVAVTLELEALSAGTLKATLSVEQGEERIELETQTFEAAAGERVRATWSAPPLFAGDALLRGRVRTTSRDDAPEDDALQAWVRVGDRRRILRVGAPVGVAGAIAVTPAELPRALAESVPDLIVLSEVPAGDLLASADALGAAVDAGAGLAVVGARRAFGPGGYAGTPLEELLPVTCGPGQERDRSLLMAVALDASGSMDAAEAGDTRYVRALESALPVDRLRTGDRLAVVLFNDAARIELAPGPPPPDLLARLAGQEPGGGTDVGAGLVAALEQLKAGTKEDLLLAVLATDSEDDGYVVHANALRRLARELAERDAQVLLVQIGDGDDTALFELRGYLGARVRARVRRAADAGEALDEIVEGELLARRAEVRRGAFAVALTPAGRDLSLPAPRKVRSFAPVRAREEAAAAATPLGILDDSETGSPPAAVLGRRGLGRTLALPLEPAAGSLWLGPLVPTLLAERTPGVALLVTRRGDRVELQVSSERPLPPNLQVDLQDAQGERSSCRLVSQTPGRHSGIAAAPSPRALHAILQDPSGARLTAAAVPSAAHGELADPGADLTLLSEIAHTTGGELLATPPSRALPVPAGPAAAQPRDLRPWAAALALLLLLLDAASATLRARFGGRALQRFFSRLGETHSSHTSE